MVWDANRTSLDDPIHNPDIFGEAATGRFEARSAADFFVRLALGECLMFAVVTMAAWDVVECHDSVAGLESDNVGACEFDDSGGFVSEDAGRGMGASCDLLKIGAADTAGMHSNENFSSADFRNRYGFEPHVIFSAIDSRPHGGWNSFR